MKELWGEKEHGLGINRKVAADQVLAFEDATLLAVQTSESLGVNPRKFLDLCEAAVDTHPSIRRRVRARKR